MVRQILLVTEGVSEGDLLKKLFKRFCSEKVEIVEFKTNIYQLYDCYESYHCRYDQLDLRKVLLEHCTRLKSSEKEIPNAKKRARRLDWRRAGSNDAVLHEQAALPMVGRDAAQSKGRVPTERVRMSRHRRQVDRTTS